MVQVHRVQGQGVRSGRVQRHLQTEHGGVLHPRTSWHQVRPQTMGHPCEREAQVANMLEPRSSFSVAFLDDRLMVMGGYR